MSFSIEIIGFFYVVYIEVNSFNSFTPVVKY